MRRLVLAAVATALVALVVVGYLALRGLADGVGTQLEAAAGSIVRRSPLDFDGGRTSVAFAPPSIAVEGATLRTREAEGGQAIAEGGRVLVVPHLSSLLRGRREIERIEFDSVRFLARPDPPYSAQL